MFMRIHKLCHETPNEAQVYPFPTDHHHVSITRLVNLV